MQRFSERPGLAHHSLCLGEVQNWSAGVPVLRLPLWEGQGSGLSGVGVGGPGEQRLAYPHPPPCARASVPPQLKGVSDPLASPRTFLAIQHDG